MALVRSMPLEFVTELTEDSGTLGYRNSNNFITAWKLLLDSVMFNNNNVSYIIIITLLVYKINCANAVKGRIRKIT